MEDLSVPDSVGDYQVLSRLAVGGMAEIFLARSPTLAQKVVIKIMLPRIAREREGAQLFQEEARIGAMVQHPNIVSFLGTGIEGGQPFLVLEYVEGCDLRQLIRWLRREGRAMEPAMAIFIAREFLRGLSALHHVRDQGGRALNIIHGDVSPSNILLSTQGEVKLGNLGIARAMLAGSAHVDDGSSGRAKGKLGYLAPEQVTGKHPTTATDVFSAGVIVAELLLGAPLFSGASELAILLAIRDASVHPLLEAPLDPALKELLAKALAREPAERFASADEFNAALDGVCASSPSARDMRHTLGALIRAASGKAEALSVPAALSAQLSAPETHADATTPGQRDQYLVRERGLDRPANYAALVEAISVGRIGPSARVSINGGPFEAIEDTPSLARHLPMSTLTPITKDALLAGAADLRRSLQRGGFARALAETAIAEETGLWLCEHRGIRKEVYVREGTPEFVGSNLVSEMLGEYLVRERVIQRSEMDLALAVMPRFEGRLGDTLVALGLVRAVDLFQHIEAQVEARLIELFTWEAGHAEFSRDVPLPESGFPLRIDVWRAIDDGIRARSSAGAADELRALVRAQEVVQVPHLSIKLTQALPPILQTLLRAARTPIDGRALVALMSSMDDPERGARALWLALALELVRWLP